MENSFRSQVGPSTYRLLADDWWSDSRDALVQSLLPPNTSCVLDIGCGRASLLQNLGECFFIGVDGHLDDSWQPSDNKAFVVADITALPFRPDAVQATTCLDVLEHLKDGDVLLKEIRRVTSDPGVSILMVPAGQYLWSSHDDEVGHFRRYNRKHLREQLAANGFRVSRVGYFFSWLVIPALLRKLMGSRINSSASGGAFSRAARMLCRNEARLVRLGVPLPIGTSLFAIAEVSHLSRGQVSSNSLS